MKKVRQFVPILKQMLGFYRYGPLPLLVWLAVVAACLFASAEFLLSQVQSHSILIEPNVMSGLCMLWMFLMVVATPLPFQALGGPLSLEFIFSRAVDRGLWLRTERAAVLIISLGPFVLNLFLSLWSPRLVFELAEPGSPAAALQNRYREVFPDSQVVTATPTGLADQLVIPYGKEMFATWLIWLGVVLIFLVAGYWSLAFTRWQRGGWHHSLSKWRPWLGLIMVHAPFYMPLALLVACALAKFNPFEECFLLFAAHPFIMTLGAIATIALIQPWSERNIREMEFEFF